MFIDVFIDMVQTAGVTADNPKGEWSMRYSLSAGKDIQFCPECQTIPKGTPFGIGYIDSQGKVLRFKDNGFQGNANVIANFETNGDIEGIYMEESFVGSWEAGHTIALCSTAYWPGYQKSTPYNRCQPQGHRLLAR